MNSNNEKSTKELLFKINFLLENGLNLDDFLKKAEEEFIFQLQDPSENLGKVLI